MGPSWYVLKINSDLAIQRPRFKGEHHMCEVGDYRHLKLTETHRNYMERKLEQFHHRYLPIGHTVLDLGECFGATTLFDLNHGNQESHRLLSAILKQSNSLERISKTDDPVHDAHWLPLPHWRLDQSGPPMTIPVNDEIRISRRSTRMVFVSEEE